MNYYATLIEVADDCPAKEAQVPQARGAKKTKPVVEYELLVKHPYKYTEEDIALRRTPFSMTSRRRSGPLNARSS
jgi:Family of unknown function (DUF6157)